MVSLWPKSWGGGRAWGREERAKWWSVMRLVSGSCHVGGDGVGCQLVNESWVYTCFCSHFLEVGWFEIRTAAGFVALLKSSFDPFPRLSTIHHVHTYTRHHTVITCWCIDFPSWCWFNKWVFTCLSVCKQARKWNSGCTGVAYEKRYRRSPVFAGTRQIRWYLDSLESSEGSPPVFSF
jgi:hypothetical protein